MESLFGIYPADASHVIAALLVGYFAYYRFNTPRSARSQTSRFQYWGSRLSYVASCLGLLLVLVWVIERQPDLVKQLAPGLMEQLKGLDVPLAAALMMTTLLPTVPGLREVDARILRAFHKMGAIPFGAIRWAQQMRDADFTIDARLLSEVRAFIDNTPALPERLGAELQPDCTVDRLRFFFTRNLALYATISEMPCRAQFGDEYPEEMDAFEKHLAAFFAQAVGFFALAAQLVRHPPDTDAEMLEDARDRFHQILLETYEELRLMLARTLLYSCSGENEVAQQVREIGFAIQCPKPVHIPANQLALDLLGVVAIFLGAALIRPIGMRPDVALWIGMSVAINYCIAALYAVIPKQVWGFADIRMTGERPILAYVASAVFTFMTSLPLSYTLYLLRPIVLGVPGGLTFPQQCIWLAMPTVMALSLAFACDNGARRETEPAWLAWTEAAAVGAIMGAMGYLVVSWLEQVGVHPSGAVAIPITIGACMGALFGGTIPQWYRRVLRQVATAAEPRAPHGAPVLGNVADGR